MMAGSADDLDVLESNPPAPVAYCNNVIGVEQVADLLPNLPIIYELIFLPAVNVAVFLRHLIIVEELIFDDFINIVFKDFPAL